MEYRYVSVEVDGIVGIRSRDGAVTIADANDDCASPPCGSLEHLWLVLRLLSAAIAQVDSDGVVTTEAG